MNIRFFCLLILPGVVFGGERRQVVDSEIVTVDLFNDAAMVTRLAEVELAVGRHTLIVEKIPASMVPGVLQASIRDEATAKILNARVSEMDLDESTEPEAIRALRERLQGIEETLEGLEDKRKRLLAQKAYANQIGESFSKQYGKIEEGRSPTVEEARETWTYVVSVLEAVDTQLRDLKNEVADITKTGQSVREELDELLQKRRQLNRQIEVELEGETAATVSLEVRYLVSRANWSPHYELRAKPQEGRMHLVYQAKVFQDTGEDWTRTKLRLHTNQANQRGDVPVLSPLRIDRGVSERDPYSKMRLEQGVAASSPAMRDEARAPEVTRSTVSFDVTLPGLVDVPSKEASNTFPIVEKSVEAEFWSEAVPILQLQAYLRAKLVNELELPLLAGKANAFIDETLSSQIHVKKTLPGESFEISLGTDSNIIVKRREGVLQDKESGFIDKTNTLHREFIITVKNAHPVAHRVIMIDQWPTSRNAKIEIRRLAPKDKEVEVKEAWEDTGIFQWHFPLQSGETREMRTEYEIIYPREWNLNREL